MRQVGMYSLKLNLKRCTKKQFFYCLDQKNRFAHFKNKKKYFKNVIQDFLAIVL